MNEPIDSIRAGSSASASRHREQRRTIVIRRFLQAEGGAECICVISCADMRVPVSVKATGVRFDETAPQLADRPGWTPERRGERAAWQRGESVFVTATAFVEFDDGGGVTRWTGTPQGPFAVPLGTDATSLLIELAEYPDDLLADLGIGEYEVSRFDFLAAPRRLELGDGLRDRLTVR